MRSKSLIRSVVVLGGVLACPAVHAQAAGPAPQYSDEQPANSPADQRESGGATPSWIRPLQPESPPPAAPAPQWHGVDLDRMVESCAGELSQGRAVEDVDSVMRENDGWRVHGRIAGGTGFSCEVAANGSVNAVMIEERLARNDVRLPTPQPTAQRLDADDPNADVAGPNDQSADPAPRAEPPQATELPRYNEAPRQAEPPRDAPDNGADWRDGNSGQTY